MLIVCVENDLLYRVRFTMIKSGAPIVFSEGLKNYAMYAEYY